MGVTTVISGGQTGVDRAALDVALDLGIPCGGWCPAGRLAEDGAIGPQYPLLETPTPIYAERTEWNVRDSDGTLVLAMGEPAGGTALTIALACKHGKPCHVVDLATGAAGGLVGEWLARHGIGRLNVAGPRASSDGEVYRLAYDFLHAILA